MSDMNPPIVRQYRELSRQYLMYSEKSKLLPTFVSDWSRILCNECGPSVLDGTRLFQILAKLSVSPHAAIAAPPLRASPPRGNRLRVGILQGHERRERMALDPAQYLRFADERLRPGFDLLSRIGDLPPGPIVELGCGTGVHTHAIAERWPDRAVSGVDASPEMLAQAASRGSRIGWVEADIAPWQAAEPAALIFSNATLHWLDAHDSLLPRLLRQLLPGGVL